MPPFQVHIPKRALRPLLPAPGQGRVQSRAEAAGVQQLRLLARSARGGRFDRNRGHSQASQEVGLRQVGLSRSISSCLEVGLSGVIHFEAILEPKAKFNT